MTETELPMYLIDESAKVAHVLAGRSVTMGRDPRNTVLIHDATVSRFHAEVRPEGAGWRLHVTGTTGAEVNGERVDAPRALKEDDRIGIGTHSFRVHKGHLPRGVRQYDGHEIALNDPALIHATATLPAIPRPAPPPKRPAWLLPLVAALVVLLTLLVLAPRAN